MVITFNQKLTADFPAALVLKKSIASYREHKSIGPLEIILETLANGQDWTNRFDDFVIEYKNNGKKMLIINRSTWRSPYKYGFDNPKKTFADPAENAINKFIKNVETALEITW